MIYLLRHGLDDEKYIGGWSNVSLIKEGKEQIVKSSKFIKDNLKINQIITSDIKRCVDSSYIVKNILGGVPLIKCDLIRELNKGNYNGRLRENLSFLEKEMIDNADIYFKYPGGESMIEFYERIKELVEKGYFDLIDNTLIVTHRGVINMLYYIFNNLNVDMEKGKFGVSHGTIHEVNLSLRKIKKIY